MGPSVTIGHDMSRKGSKSGSYNVTRPGASNGIHFLHEAIPPAWSKIYLRLRACFDQRNKFCRYQ